MPQPEKWNLTNITSSAFQNADNTYIYENTIMFNSVTFFQVFRAQNFYSHIKNPRTTISKSAQWSQSPTKEELEGFWMVVKSSFPADTEFR